MDGLALINEDQSREIEAGEVQLRCITCVQGDMRRVIASSRSLTGTRIRVTELDYNSCEALHLQG